MWSELKPPARVYIDEVWTMIVGLDIFRARFDTAGSVGQGASHTNRSWFSLYPFIFGSFGSMVYRPMVDRVMVDRGRFFTELFRT